MRASLRQPTLPKWLWVVAGLAVAILALSSYAFLQMQARQAAASAEENLTAIAILKAKQIADWRRERYSDADMLAGSPSVVADVDQWLQGGQAEAEAAVVARLEILRSYEQYQDVMVLDTTGQPRWSLSGVLSQIHPADRGALAEAFRTGRPVFADLHAAPSDGGTRLGLIAPLQYTPDRPVGAVLLKISPETYLYPLIESWPVNSSSAESLLVRREGDEVVWLSNLRYQPAAALNLRMPLSRIDVPAVMAVLGKQGAFRGNDYRGVEVFSALAPVPDSPWFLVAKQDTAEALAPLRTITLLVGVSLAGLVGIVLVFALLVGQQMQRRYFQAIYAAEEEKLALARHFEYRVKYANDIILLADANFRIVEANDRALEAYGYTRAEIVRLSVTDLVAPEDAAQAAERRQTLETHGALQQRGLHRRRDGAVFPVEISARAIDIEGQRFYQGIYLDITDRLHTEEVIRSQNEQLQAQNEELAARHEELMAQHEELQSQTEELVAQQEDLQHAEREARESEAHYRALFDNSLSGVTVNDIVLNADGTPVDYVCRLANPAFETHTGLRVADVLGRPASEIYPGLKETGLVQTYGKVALTGEPVSFETHFERLQRHHSIKAYQVGRGRFAVLFDDITQRKVAEYALRDSEARFHSLYSGMTEGVALHEINYDEEGRAVNYTILEVNPQFEEILNLRRDAVAGRLATEVYGTPEAPYLAEYARVVSTGAPYQFETFFPPLDKHFYISVARMGPGQFATLFFDITERKKMEAALRDNEELFSLFMQYSPIYAFVKTVTPTESRVLQASENYLDMTGIPGRQMIGKTMEALFPVDFAVKITADDWEVVSKGEVLRLDEDLNGRHYTTIKWPIVQHGRTLLAGYTIDITERVRSEQERRQAAEDLRQALERLELATRAGRLGIWDWDIVKDELVWDDRMYELYGVRRDQFGGAYAAWLDGLHPDDRAASNELLQQALRDEREFDTEFRVRWPDHTVRWLKAFGQVTRDADGKPRRMTGVNFDITDRRQAEEALRESETRFRTIFEQAAVGVSQVNSLTGEYLLINQKHCDIVGYSREEMLHSSFQKITHPDDLEPDLANMRRLLAGDIRTFTMEKRFVRKDGSVVWVSLTVSPMWAEGETPSCHIAVVQEITERKQTEAALRESEARFRSIIENTEAGYFFIDQEGLIRDVNPAWVKLYHYASADEVLGRHFTAIQRLDDVALAREVVAGILANDARYLAGEFSRKCKDGAVGYHSFSARPVSQGGVVVGVEGFIIDTTARRQAEAALARERKLLRTLLDTLPDSIYFKDIQSHFIQINPALARLFGLNDPSEAVGKTDFDFLAAAFAREAHEDEQAILRSGEPIIGKTECVAFDSGQIRWVLTTKMPLYDDAGQLTGTFGLSRDITDQKRAEALIQEQAAKLQVQNEALTLQNEELITQGRALAEAEADLQRINDQLEMRIQARSTELQAANAELQMANAALLRAGRLKDEFLANMSHELRTPLTGILGLVEVMEKGIYGSVNDKQRQALLMAQSSGEHLLQLINDILDLSKVEAGKMELQLETVVVADICQASLDFIMQPARKKNITWRLQLDQQVAAISADPRRLKQMLVNLLSNAVKFTPEGGRVGLEVEGDSGSREVRITVWDSGIGVPLEQQRYLFQPFVQLDGSLARKYEGTGLGLALVSSLAELHGGKASMSSPGIGQGARFTITLPWTPTALEDRPDSLPRTADSPKVTSLAGLLGRPPLILAVDDSPVTLMVVSNYLEAADCRVLTASGGHQALELAFSERPDLVLLDVQMPDMDGLTVLRELRARWQGPRLPVVLLTALAMSGDRERLMAAGADDYLSKPMNLEELRRVVTRQLSESR